MRRRRPEKRSINPDPKFNDLQVSKFMNYLLVGGKKGIAEKILYDAFDIVKEKAVKIQLMFSKKL
jgi:small subunit ribosomal protein S7